MADVWAAVRPEREALASDLEPLDESAWGTQSLCPKWTVREVLAHMTALARMTPAMFFRKLVTSGFNPARLQRRDIATELGANAEETLERFRAIAAGPNRLPGTNTTLLGETIVHAEDIRRPLGMKHDYPYDALVAVADLYKGTNLVAGSKRRIAGLSLEATDTAWRTGIGPTVAGPMLSLLMVMAGRSVAMDDLDGEGLETLRSRF
jgi:uncharacterized protein (TIGR03083 family)